MSVLLLLSALLSALTGVGAATRAPQVAQAVAGAAEAATVARARSPLAALRPVQASPGIRAVAAVMRPAAAVPSREPIWASRRRE